MIKLKNIICASTGVQTSLSEFQEQQISRKIEKYLMEHFSIICETEVKE